MANTKDRAFAAAGAFILLALGLSGLYWLLFRLGILSDRDVWGAVRGYIPAMAGLICAAGFYGQAGFKRVWADTLRWRVPWRLYALLFGGALAVNTIVVLVAIGISHADAALGPVQPLKFALIFIGMIFIDGPLGEEMGWRGFLLPALLDKFGPVTASLLVGLIWYLWHLPLYWTDGAQLTLPALADFLLTCLTYAVIFTWFYLRSGASVFLCVLLHDAANYCIFMRNRLFPATVDVTSGELAFLALITALALAAALDLRRRPATALITV